MKQDRTGQWDRSVASIESANTANDILINSSELSQMFIYLGVKTPEIDTP
jgi:hypothetical protein